MIESTIKKASQLLDVTEPFGLNHMITESTRITNNSIILIEFLIEGTYLRFIVLIFDLAYTIMLLISTHISRALELFSLEIADLIWT